MSPYSFHLFKRVSLLTFGMGALFALGSFVYAADKEDADWHFYQALYGPVTNGKRDLTTIQALFRDDGSHGQQTTTCTVARGSTPLFEQSCNPNSKAWSDTSKNHPTIPFGGGHVFQKIGYFNPTDTAIIYLRSTFAEHNAKVTIDPPRANKFTFSLRKFYVKRVTETQKLISMLYNFEKGADITGQKFMIVQFKDKNGNWQSTGVADSLAQDTAGINAGSFSLNCEDGKHGALDHFELRICETNGNECKNFKIDDCKNKTALFKNVPPASVVNTCNAVDLALEDDDNNAVSLQADQVFDLSSNYPGQFFTDSNCTNPSTSVVLPAEQDTVTFYYKASQQGQHVIVGSSPEAEDIGVQVQANGIINVALGLYCGDYIMDSGEECDSGGMDTSSCLAACSLSICGDGYMNSAAGEACDDGNATGGDGCNASCQIEICGNNITDTGEQCDMGSYDSSSCNYNCTMPICGDGYMNSAAGEACDDGNTIDGDGCSSTCQVVFCGNYMCEMGETNASCPTDCWY